MSGTLECACGHRMRLERIEDAPACCPKCGGGREPAGMNRAARRAAKAAFAKQKLRQSKEQAAAFAKLAADMDAMRDAKAPDLEPPGAA